MLLWAEGWDHYGTNISFPKNGAWAELGNVAFSLNARTGTYALNLAINTRIRRVLGDTFDSAGFGYAFYLAGMPSATGAVNLMKVLADNGVTQCTLGMTSSGRVRAWTGDSQPNDDGDRIIGESDVCIYAQSYQHFEAHVGVGVLDGFVEVRVNGVTVLNLTGVNTSAPGIGGAAQVEMGTQNATSASHMQVDDMFAWNTEGTANNDFIGDKKVFTVFPDADTAVEEWDPATGTDSYQNLNKHPPQDTTYYLGAPDPGVTTTVGLEDIPPEVVAISGVYVATRAQKTDAGNAKILVSLENGSDVTPGVEHPLSQAMTYYGDVFDVDPATGSPWTAAGFATARYTLERTE